MACEIIHGDALEVLKGMADNSVDAVVTDPPYGISFLGHKWDYDVPTTELWVECLRVLKPGGHLLAFAGTRTQHRMAVRIEDAGFEIRDMIAWVYGSGFPKSKNLQGEWKGWGTTLKPAMEPITMARKRFAGGVAECVEQNGTGALNIDGCRIGTTKDVPGAVKSGRPIHAASWLKKHGHGSGYGPREMDQSGMNPNIGRWPANFIHDGSDEIEQGMPLVKTGICKKYSGGGYSGGLEKRDDSPNAENGGDSGSASRFFYCAKADKEDRDEGLPRGTSSDHPTVKPTKLMRYLVRLVTPPKGVVLDPFTGTGSTGKAAALEGFGFIGIEREAEYVAIAKARIAEAQRQLGLFA